MAEESVWLLTGVTSGLGAATLHHMLHTQKYDPKKIVATSRSESQRAKFEAMGVQFRVLDYTRADTLVIALKGVDNFFFIAAPERDNEKRIALHRNVIQAAKAAKVGKIWYNSLAFGGYGFDSKIGFQMAHYVTEKLLQESGVDFVNLRAGIYSDAFPLFLNWYPSSKEVLLPKLTPPTTEGKIAFTSREELGEAHAALFAKGLKAFPQIQPRGDLNLVLLTSQTPESLDELVVAINRAQGSNIPLKHLEPADWIKECAKDDEGGKPTAWFEARLVFTQGVCDGDAKTTDPAMELLLGRKPEYGTQTVEKLIKADKEGYTWHQNHAR